MSVDHDSIKANDLLVEGKKLKAEGKHEEAVASFDKAIKIKPEFADVWKSKGDALQELERYDDAIACYDKVIEIDPKSRYAWDLKGVVLEELERYDDAIASFDKAIEIVPKDAFAWRRKGNSLAKLGRYDDALVSFDKSIEIDPKDGLTCVLKGMILEKLERYDDALVSFDKSIEIDPKDGLAWRHKGIALAKLERYDDALACYDKVIEMHPGDTITWDNQKIALAKLGRHEYDPRCANCDHYPWTDVFVSGRGWAKGQPRWGHGSAEYNEQHKCECKCHDAPTYGKIMRFSLKGKDAETSRHVMYAVKLAVCPFCKRSEFEDSVYNKINDDGGTVYQPRRGYWNPYGHLPRDELLAEDLKATGAPEREHEFDYNDLYESGKHTGNQTLLTPCTGNHKHEWYECACGRKVCKISFRNYFGYEISDDLFDNDFVDRSHYSERTKALLDKDEDRYGHRQAREKETREKPKSAELPTYATMATIEKVWGKLPRYRKEPGFNQDGWNNPSDFPSKYEGEETRPNPRRIRDISMSEKILSPEDISNYFLEVKEERIKIQEGSFVYDVSGMGTTTAEKLLEKFGTPYKVFSATEEEIAKITFGRKYNRNYSETRAKKIRKDLDDYTKEYGSLEDILDKKRKESFIYKDYRNPSYTYSSESFEETS